MYRESSENIMALKITKYIVSLKRKNQDGESYLMNTNSIVSPYSYKGDKDLVEVSFGEYITKISSGAFQDCTSLTTITFHDSLHRIDVNAFDGCTALQNIIFPDSLEEVDCWLGARRVAKITLHNPSSDELIENLKQGYAMDLYHKGEYRDDYWD